MTNPPSIGSVVHYQLSANDCATVDLQSPQRDGDGRYLRNPVSEGQVLPAQVVAVFGPVCVNLVVQLDGRGQHWVTSRCLGDQPGTWSWPARSPLALADVVLYRGKQGLLAPRCAIVTATVESLDPRGVDSGEVPAITDDDHAHLWVFTPGEKGGFAEFDVPFGGAESVGEIPPGAWCWPPRV